MSEQTNNPYYIFIICGDVPMVIGKTGQYVRKIKNALPFKNKIDALEYVDKRRLILQHQKLLLSKQEKHSKICLNNLCRQLFS